ncbi:hypothetical protein ACLOJK_000614 [Asimina triloba]
MKRAKIEIAAQRERERPVSDLGFGREEDKRTPSMLVLDLRLPQLFHESVMLLLARSYPTIQKVRASMEMTVRETGEQENRRIREESGKKSGKEQLVKGCLLERSRGRKHAYQIWRRG